jgi:hypothetical protein
LAPKFAQYPARPGGMKLMKVFVSDLIHDNTSDSLIHRYESNSGSIKKLPNTFGIEKTLDPISPDARFEVGLPECSTSTRWFRDAIPGDMEA